MFLRCITQDMAAILNNEAVAYLPEDVYLAGGTAVALYFGHRLSVDFDFFTPKEFDSLDLSTILSEQFKSNFKVTKNIITKNTIVMGLNETGFSLMTYRYPLLDDTVSMENIPVPVASQLDLSLMKFVAISQRGSCKDFIDLKILIERNNYSFQDIAQKLSRKYSVGDEMLFQIKMSLVYFDDAEKDINVNVYKKNKKSFEILQKKEWDSTKAFFEKFIMADNPVG